VAVNERSQAEQVLINIGGVDLYRKGKQKKRLIVNWPWTPVMYPSRRVERRGRKDSRKKLKTIQVVK
jgi:hypothetical protein